MVGRSEETKGSLVLFLDLGFSFKKGERFGQLTRTAELYEYLLRQNAFSRIYWFTYSHHDTARLESYKRSGIFPEGMHVLTPPKYLGSRLGNIVYSFLGPFLHLRSIKGATILKTHQVSGSWTALVAKCLTGAPLLFRLGYPLSFRFRTERKWVRLVLTRALESVMVRIANGTAVSSSEALAYYREYSAVSDIRLISSHVDMSRCRSVVDYDTSKPVLFVGRLEPVKNIEMLIRACARVGRSLHIFGIGSSEEHLRTVASEEGVDVVFHGVLPNRELIKRYRDYCVYVLCSTREGMPKTLIEAMACGLICVGTPVGGILELITDGETGFLCTGFEVGDIAAALSRAVADGTREMGARARSRVLAQHDLPEVALRELEFMSDILAARPGHSRISSHRLDDNRASS